MRVTTNAGTTSNYKKLIETELSAALADPEIDSLSFDEIRAKLSVSKTELPDGEIHQVVIDAGYEVNP